MPRPRRRLPLVCTACGGGVRRGRYRTCPRGCGAKLHTMPSGPCMDAHAPICPNHTPHPLSLEEQ